MATTIIAVLSKTEEEEYEYAWDDLQKTSVRDLSIEQY